MEVQMNKYEIFNIYYKALFDDKNFKKDMLLIDKPYLEKCGFFTVKNVKKCGIEMREYVPTYIQQSRKYQINGYKRTIYYENDVKKQLLDDFCEDSNYLISYKLLDFFYDLYLNSIFYVGKQKTAITFLYALVTKDEKYYGNLSDKDVFLGSLFLKLYLKNIHNDFIYTLNDIKKLKNIFSTIISLDLPLLNYLSNKIMQSEIKYVYQITKNSAICLVTTILIKIDRKLNISKALQIFLLFFKDVNGLNILKLMTLQRFLISLIYIMKKLEKSACETRFIEVCNVVREKMGVKLDGSYKQICYVHNTVFLKYYRLLLKRYNPVRRLGDFIMLDEMKNKKLPFKVRIVDVKEKIVNKRKIFVFSSINERICIINKNSKKQPDLSNIKIKH